MLSVGEGVLAGVGYGFAANIWYGKLKDPKIPPDFDHISDSMSLFLIASACLGVTRGLLHRYQKSNHNYDAQMQKSLKSLQEQEKIFTENLMKLEFLYETMLVAQQSGNQLTDDQEKNIHNHLAWARECIAATQTDSTAGNILTNKPDSYLENTFNALSSFFAGLGAGTVPLMSGLIYDFFLQSLENTSYGDLFKTIAVSASGPTALAVFVSTAYTINKQNQARDSKYCEVRGLDQANITLRNEIGTVSEQINTHGLFTVRGPNAVIEQAPYSRFRINRRLDGAQVPQRNYDEEGNHQIISMRPN